VESCRYDSHWSRIQDKLIYNIVAYKKEIVLVLLNFITHYLFIFQYKFYSDDWMQIVYSYSSSYSYFHLLLDSQRPISWVLFKFIAEVIPHQPLWYHLFGFGTTSLMLLLIYEIAKIICIDFGWNGPEYPFITAVVYCVLFNKDELYPWAILCLGISYLTYLFSFYCFLRRDQPGYLLISMITYALGLFTYEIGFALPLIYLAYDFLKGRRVWTGLMYGIPLTGYLLVRITHWFGYSYVFFYDQGIGNWDIHALLSHSVHIVWAVFYIPLKQMIFAMIGLQQLPLSIVGGLLMIDVVVVYLILNRGVNISNTSRISPKYLLFSLITITSFALPYVLLGFIESRGFIFIDIGLALLIVPALLRLPDRSGLHIGLTVVIALSIIICQGLYVNWVMAGNIQSDVDRYIHENAEEIEQYNYVYFNTTSFALHKPYKVEGSILVQLKDLYHRTFGQKEIKQEDRLLQGISSSSCWNCTYAPYYNAPGIYPWDLSSILRGNMGASNVPLLLYGDDSLHPVGISEVTITYEDKRKGGPAITVEKSRVFEIHYCQVSGIHPCQ
jgi:hypothetical protein